MRVKIVNKSENVIPEYKHQGDSGMDVRSTVDTIIWPRQSKVIPTDNFVDIPDGYEIQVRPRSGLSKKGLWAALGTIDSSYLGNIGICLCNMGWKPFRIHKGDRIAQIVLQKVYKITWEEVDSLVEKGDRGANGFGSTGLK